MSVLDGMRRRAEASGFDYPLAIPLSCLVVTFGLAVAAVAQRDALVPPGWPLLAGVAAVAPIAWQLVRGTKSARAMALYAVTAVAGTSLLLLSPTVEADVAPLMLSMMAGGVAATASLAISIPAVVAGVAVVVVATATGHLADDTLVLFAVLVLLGWMTGFMLQSQLRLVHHEREAQAERMAQAATVERQRIAREVHDVIAHSLSVTLLHLTGARRALQQDADVAEAIDALTDAERLGREAMADIRRTVGLLGSASSGSAPEPGIADLPDLVDDFRNAGLSVRFEQRGDLSGLSAASGLGLYRIAQESLANVAKHAPGAGVAVALAGSDGAVELAIRNDRPSSGPTGKGNGLTGMRQRVEMLGGRLQVGPDQREWLVRAIIPVDAARCRAKRLGPA